MDSKQKIIEILKSHATPLTVKQMLKFLPELSRQRMDGILRGLVLHGAISSTTDKPQPDGCSNVYALVGVKPADKPVKVPPKQNPITGTYIGHELRPYNGRKDANDHMRYGSIVNGVNVGYKPAGCGV
jgi:hypothetical protein